MAGRTKRRRKLCVASVYRLTNKDFFDATPPTAPAIATHSPVVASHSPVVVATHSPIAVAKTSPTSTSAPTAQLANMSLKKSSESIHTPSSAGISQQFTGNSVASATQGDEPEVIKEWREKQLKIIAAKDAKSQAAHQDILAKAQKTLEDMHKEYTTKRDASRTKAAAEDAKLTAEAHASFDPKLMVCT